MICNRIVAREALSGAMILRILVHNAPAPRVHRQSGSRHIMIRHHPKEALAADRKFGDPAPLGPARNAMR